MKTLITLMLLSSTLACKTMKNRKKDQQIIYTNEVKADKKAVLGDINEVGDSINILNASVEGNNLIIEVSYSGGCETHEFKLIGSPMIAKSLPPIRSIVLVHLGKGDACRQLVTEKLSFDIRDFAYTVSESEIYLNLKGFEKRILYKFKP
jgi:hypothetical protein